VREPGIGSKQDLCGQHDLACPTESLYGQHKLGCPIEKAECHWQNDLACQESKVEQDCRQHDLACLAGEARRAKGEDLDEDPAGHCPELTILS
jgi:hypothetical protein